MTQGQIESRHGLELEVLEEDRLSCRLRSVRHQGPALADAESLQAKAENLIETVTYLEDRLRVVEQEPEAVLLRSETPRENAEAVEYYEVKLTRAGQTHLDFRRYQRAETEIVKQDMVLSHRQLERLGQDLQALSSELQKN